MQEAALIAAEEQLIRTGVDELEPLRFQWLLFTLSCWLIGIVLAIVIYITYSANRGNTGNQLQDRRSQVTRASKDDTSNQDGSQNIVVVSSVISLIAIIALGVISWKKGKKLHEQFDQWRDKIINSIDSTAQFKQDSYLDQHHFDSSGLNSKTYNTYSGGSFLRVQDMQMSYLSIQHRYKETYYTTETTYVNGQATTRQVQKEREVVIPIFDGMLVILPAPLPHAGSVMLQPKQSLVKALLKSYSTDFIPNNLHKITVASPDLNNNYLVGTSDKFVGHRILTPTLMVSLWEYRGQFKAPPRYSYTGNLLYILLSGISIGCGKRPSKWMPVTTSRLTQVVADCRSSLEFLKATAQKLKPT